MSPINFRQIQQQNNLIICGVYVRLIQLVTSILGSKINTLDMN
jgi:hypothetical protein